MALIVVTKTASALQARGDLGYLRNADPWADPGGSVRYSLTAGWRWNAGELEVFSDRLGLIPIFFSAKDGRVLVSDSLSELVAAAPSERWDLDALAVFLRIGFFLGTDTPFEGVRVLPRALNTTVTAENFALPTEAEPYRGEELSPGRREATERYIELFRDSIASRHLDGSVALPLSGGRDSRHILFEMIRSARKPDLAITFSLDTSHDLEYQAALRLCEEVDVPHMAVNGDASLDVLREAEKNRETHHLADEHTWYLDVGAALRDQRVDLIFDGIGGDVLSNGLFHDECMLSAFEQARPDEVARILLDESRSLPHLSKYWQSCLSWERAEVRVQKEARLHMQQPNPLASFYFWNRTRREIALAPLCLAQGVEVVMPYLAPDLVEFLLSLPASRFGAPGFHDEVIQHAFPEYAHLPYASTKQNPHPLPTRPSVRNQLRYISRCRSAAAVGLTHRSFVATRLLRVLGTQDATRDEWWLRQILYLLSLRELGDR